jgi:hypothetical protein
MLPEKTNVYPPYFPIQSRTVPNAVFSVNVGGRKVDRVLTALAAGAAFDADAFLGGRRWLTFTRRRTTVSASSSSSASSISTAAAAAAFGGCQ